MTDQTNDHFHGLTPLAGSDVPGTIRRAYIDPAVFDIPRYSTRYLVYYRADEADRDPWRVVSEFDPFRGVWRPTPEAALKAAGLDPKLLDEMRGPVPPDADGDREIEWGATNVTAEQWIREIGVDRPSALGVLAEDLDTGRIGFAPRAVPAILLAIKMALAARDATIAEQAEALEGYRKAVVTDHEVVRNTEMLSEEGKKRVFAKWAEQASNRLPAHEIDELRRRGVEVGEDGGNER